MCLPRINNGLLLHNATFGYASGKTNNSLGNLTLSVIIGSYSLFEY